MNEILIACRDGAVVTVPCRDEGQIIYVSRKNIPKNAFAWFNDDLRSCMIDETGRFLDTLPPSDLAGHWFFP